MLTVHLEDVPTDQMKRGIRFLIDLTDSIIVFPFCCSIYNPNKCCLLGFSHFSLFSPRSPYTYIALRFCPRIFQPYFPACLLSIFYVLYKIVSFSCCALPASPAKLHPRSYNGLELYMGFTLSSRIVEYAGKHPNNTWSKFFAISSQRTWWQYE